MFSLVLNPMAKLNWFKENRRNDMNTAQLTLLEAISLFVFLA